MDLLDNELERRARELLAYLDMELAIEESLPFAVGFLVKKCGPQFLQRPRKRWRLRTDAGYIGGDAINHEQWWSSSRGQRAVPTSPLRRQPMRRSSPACERKYSEAQAEQAPSARLRNRDRRRAGDDEEVVERHPHARGSAAGDGKWDVDAPARAGVEAPGEEDEGGRWTAREDAHARGQRKQPDVIDVYLRAARAAERHAEGAARIIAEPKSRAHLFVGKDGNRLAENDDFEVWSDCGSVPDQAVAGEVARAHVLKVWQERGIGAEDGSSIGGDADLRTRPCHGPAGEIAGLEARIDQQIGRGGTDHGRREDKNSRYQRSAQARIHGTPFRNGYRKLNLFSLPKTVSHH